MLEQFDPDITMNKDDFERLLPELRQKLGDLERKIRDANIPTILVFEGWKASGISQLINRFIYPLDPRYFQVHSILEPIDEERSRPLLWRFWVKIPKKGDIAIFDRSWYFRMIHEKNTGSSIPDLSSEVFSEIQVFEKHLTDNGYLVIKFFLHISKKEQKKRFKKMAHVQFTEKVSVSNDWQQLKDYKIFFPLFERILQKTDAPLSPWVIVEAKDQRYALIKVMQHVISMYEDRLSRINELKEVPQILDFIHHIRHTSMLNTSSLEHVDLSLSITREEYQERIISAYEKLPRLQIELLRKKVPIIILFEGWDASGKGGAIIRLTQALNPRGYRVEPVGPPSDEEKKYHYLWRFYRKLPRQGHMVIFDRSWYGRVLVERIEGLCAEHEWNRAYNEINEMEDILIKNGAIIIKFWLHIDRKEQLNRFIEREGDPFKRWKITADDWRNRDKWGYYELAVDEMLKKTSTYNAPWNIIEANHKYLARIKVLETVISIFEKHLGSSETS